MQKWDVSWYDKTVTDHENQPLEKAAPTGLEAADIVPGGLYTFNRPDGLVDLIIAFEHQSRDTREFFGYIAGKTQNRMSYLSLNRHNWLRWKKISQ